MLLKELIDLLRMKAYYFEGEKGEKVIEKEIPENFVADAKKYRAELVERIVEHDDEVMSSYLEGKEISMKC
jgi:elongation factor G